MSAPKLTVPLRLETKERQADGLGGHRAVWRTIGLVYAEMRSGIGRLRGAEAGPESVVGWTITLRAFPQGDPRRPIAGQRLRMGSRSFRIDAVAEADPAGRHLRVIAEEE
ncbi:head-tail adaptor protein [Paracoccus aurantiacus]|uniref:Head-tail adaptor protein n=1 Tax=Paracoccus aurantiacus TaxID=2599412 RepID=A0A5C6S8P9_9RHOB|nr:head-tail adaptor protein [Paracoccus aurantiacus]TXB70907.1 head-tail adaptor protein [Paracoccus aurantiacus]